MENHGEDRAQSAGAAGKRGAPASFRMVRRPGVSQRCWLNHKDVSSASEHVPLQWVISRGVILT